MLFENYSYCSFSCHPKTIGYIFKKQGEEQVCIPEIIRLIVMKMKMKMKNRSRIYDINLGTHTRKSRPRSRHGHEYSKYKKFLSMMMLICIKQYLSNI